MRSPDRLEVSATVRERYPMLFAPHQERGRFFNPWQTQKLPGVRELLKWQLGDKPWSEAKTTERPVAPDREGLSQFGSSTARAKILWMGHASFLLELDGFRCLVDPVYGRVGAFVKRFGAEPFPLEALPSIDAVFLTHGHYDHLDVQTLSALAATHREARFVVPLGQARYLPKGCADVLEVDWWDRVDFGGVEAFFVPAQHWHRRGPLDQNQALWGGWVLRGTSTFYHSGDSGYFDGFGALREIFDDVEVAMLPVGAFEPRWFMASQHMNPEDSLRAFADLGANHFVAMHWGTYDLTDEPRNLGADVIRTLGEDRLGDRLHVPAPGGFLGL